MQRFAKLEFTLCDINHIPGLATVVSALACASPPPARIPAESSGGAGSVQVSADRSSYQAGSPLTLTVHNGSADSVAFNPCTRSLERDDAGSWSAVPEPGRICTMEAWILAPGERRAGPTELPADLAAGRYRAVLAFTVESANPSAERQEARTTPFAVER